MIKYIKSIIWKYLPDKICLKRIFYHKFWYNLNLKNPKTFNEKLQRLKLYDRKPEYTQMVDKYEAKKYVANIIWEKYIIPTLWIYNKFDEIDFDKLPNQFVLKCTHDSGTVIICKDKKNFDIQTAKKKINERLEFNYYYLWREWPYKNVKPRIIVEPYLEDEKYGELRDYKFFTFSGNMKIMFVASNRQGNGDTYFDFFDRYYNHLEIINGHPMNPKCPEKPVNFDKMIGLAEKISNKFSHLRVDFYEISWKIYFWELTFYHWSGMVPFDPECWDKKLGDWIQLPTKKK